MMTELRKTLSRLTSGNGTPGNGLEYAIEAHGDILAEAEMHEQKVAYFRRKLLKRLEDAGFRPKGNQR